MLVTLAPVHLPDWQHLPTAATRVGALLMACAALALAAPVQAQSRGELLYATHCVACHSTQIHWRDKRLATDWGSLLVQVRRWQANAALGWTEDDVVQVTRHLNDTIYHFPRPMARQALMVSLARPAPL